MKQECKRPSGSCPSYMIDTWGCEGCEFYKWINANGMVNKRAELFTKGWKIFSNISNDLTRFYEEMTITKEIDNKGQAHLLPYFSTIKYLARNLTRNFIINRQIENGSLPEFTLEEPSNQDQEYELLINHIDKAFHKIDKDTYLRNLNEINKKYGPKDAE